MTVNFFEDDPDDFIENYELEDFFDNEPDDDLTVDFAFDLCEMRLACIYTGGLWQLGIPELYIRPPRNQQSGDAMADARLAVFLATGLIHLGYGLLATDGFDIPPYWAELDGQQVKFWLGNQEPPFERLARNLDSDVDTVIQVHCSLWHAPLLGDG